MKRLSAALTALPLLATTLLLAGCASSSGSAASGASSAQASASGTWTGTSDHPGSPAATTSAPGATASAPGSSAPSAPVSAAPSAPGSAGAASGPRIPASATSAQLTYLGPKMAKPVRTEKNVTGATFRRLADDLNALQPRPAGTVECMVLTGENATVTITANGHTWMFTVDGSPCRGVRLTKDGVVQPNLTNSMALLNQIRAIAGFTGMAHPLTG